MGDHRLFADFSTEELEAEIKRRKPQKPEPRLFIDWTPVHDYILDVVLNISLAEGVPDDLENALLETVIDVMYERPYEFWAWWRNETSRR